MSAAYVDSSCLVALALNEPSGANALAELNRHDVLLSSNLTEAEFRAALTREGLGTSTALLGDVEWIVPDRPLSEEIARVLTHGYVRGADLWHLATALFVAPGPAELPFLTLDERQRQVARALGFPVPL